MRSLRGWPSVRSCALGVLAAALGAGPSGAVCTLANASPGELALDGSLLRWTTVRSASIEIVHSGDTSVVTLTTPSLWRASPPREPATTFTLSPVLVGGPNSGAAFTYGRYPTARLTAAGLDTLKIEVMAEAASFFPSGNYQAEVVVTCDVQ